MPHAEDWRKQAACREADPEIFFPVSIRDVGTIAEAKAVCGRCAVREACLRYAQNNKEDNGIWGGLTEEERRAERRRGSRVRQMGRTAATSVTVPPSMEPDGELLG